MSEWFQGEIQREFFLKQSSFIENTKLELEWASLLLCDLARLNILYNAL